MRSPCDPPKFDQHDWSQFDFSRWHLDGVQLDAVASAIAGLSSNLFNSPEWAQNFKTAVGNLQEQAVAFYQDSTKQFEAAKTSTAIDFDQRIVAARDQAATIARANEAAAAPLVAPTSAEAYQFAVKVTDSSGVAGLPGLSVQLMDPRNPGSPLTQAGTDANGNAILTVAAATAKELDNLHTAVQVVGPSGNVLQKISDAACVRLNQTETKVIPLKDSADIQESKSAAAALRSLREAQAQRLNARIDLLQRERAARLQTLDCKIQQNQAIIDAIQSPAAPGTDQAAASAPQAPPSAQETAASAPPPPVAESPAESARPSGSSSPPPKPRPSAGAKRGKRDKS